MRSLHDDGAGRDPKSAAKEERPASRGAHGSRPALEPVQESPESRDSYRGSAPSPDAVCRGPSLVKTAVEMWRAVHHLWKRIIQSAPNECVIGSNSNTVSTSRTITRG